MGVLAGIEDATGFDLRDCEYFVGTSAGSIVAAHLVAGDARRAARGGRAPTTAPARPAPSRSRAGASRRCGARPAGRAAGRSPRRSPFAPAGARRRRARGAVVRALLLRGLPRPPDTLRNLRAPFEAVGRAVRRAPAGRGRRPRQRPPGRVRQPGRARRDRRRGGRGLVHGPVAVRPGRRSAAASTSTAASGAPPTSTPPRPGRDTHVAVPEPHRQPRRSAPLLT